MKSFFSKKIIIAVLTVLSMILTIIFGSDKTINHEKKEYSQEKSKERESKGSQKFSEYLLALSWSPTYCLERDPQGEQPQCRLSDKRKKHRFIVHGLWPQSGTYEMLAYCTEAEKEIGDDIVRKYFYLMPSIGLMKHEWTKHGTCSNLNQSEYFAKIESLYKKFDIEVLFKDINQTQKMSVVDIKQMIVQHIPELNEDNFVITCRKNKLSEVRICLDKNDALRECKNFEMKSGRCQKDMPITIPF